MKRTEKAFSALGVSLFALAIGTTPLAASASDQQSVRDELDQLSQRVDQLSKQTNPADKARLKWNVTGYMDAGLVSTNANGMEDHFTAGHFNPIFHFSHGDRLFFESEVEMETNEEAETGIDLEYSALSVFLNDKATLVVGKWLTPVGQFVERLHPSWINKLPTMPVGLGHEGVMPISEVGMQVRGAVPAGNSYFTYVVGVGNGPEFGEEGFVLEGFPVDNNSDKSFVGRIGYFPRPDLEIGLSWMRAKTPGAEADTGPVTEGDYKLWVADAAYTHGNWAVRAEYYKSELSSFYGLADETDTSTSLIPKTEWKVWYAQAAYRIPDSKLEPVVRFGGLDIDGFYAGDSEKRSDIGLNYWLAPSAAVKFAVERRNYDDPGADDVTQAMVQFTYGF